MTKKIHTLLTALSLFALIAVTAGCNSSGEKVPDVSGVKVDLQTFRFDKDLYAIDTNNIAPGLQQLAAKYPDFLNYFLDTLMAYGIRGNYNDTVQGIRNGLKPFLSFKDYADLQDSIDMHYPDTKQTDEELLKGFKNLKYYFATYPVPKVLYVNLGLSKWASFPLDSSVFCIALDMFLGDHFPHYKSVGLHDYLAAHRRREYIPVSVFSALYKGYHPFQPDDKTLLDLVLQRGQEQYFLHKILPGKPDSLLFGFTQRQVDWCNANEALVYNFFIQQNLLYSKEAHAIMPYVTDGPFAKNFESPSAVIKSTPGNVGAWLGYKIVNAYMAQHPKTTLAELLSMQADPARFLGEAKYKPK
ncbi:MAG: hypothetical protein V4649_13800 [Bacteroidota bacterium]